MSTEPERIELHADEAAGSRIAEAAELLGESVSAFVVRSARAEAERVLATADRTIMPAEQFDLIIASLDEPEEVPALIDMVSRRRRFRRV